MGTSRKRLQAARAMQRDVTVEHEKAHALVAARLAGDDAQSIAIVATMDLVEARNAAWMIAEAYAEVDSGNNRSVERALRYYADLGALRGAGGVA